MRGTIPAHEWPWSDEKPWHLLPRSCPDCLNELANNAYWTHRQGRWEWSCAPCRKADQTRRDRQRRTASEYIPQPSSLQERIQAHKRTRQRQTP